MSAGGYDGPYSSFSHGDSWRAPVPGPSVYERPQHFIPHRRTPSPPTRRYMPYDSYYSQENNYRPNNYRPDEENIYYSRSPSPDRYTSRVLESDPLDRSIPWQPPARDPVWQDMPMAPASPVISQGPKDHLLATRMFEPSDSWKQNHVKDPSRPPIDRYSSYRRFGSISPERGGRSPLPFVRGDSYRPAQTQTIVRAEYDSYRPGWSRSPSDSQRRHSRRSSRYQGRRVSGSESMTSSVSPRSRHGSPISRQARTHSRSRWSSSRGRRSISRSRSRGCRSSSRGRRSLSLGRRSSRGRRSSSHGQRSLSRGSRPTNGTQRSSGGKNGSAAPGSSVKASWDRPATIFVTASNAKDQGAKEAAQPLLKSSRKRSASRSSIASTHVSDRAPSPPLQPVEQIGLQPSSKPQPGIPANDAKQEVTAVTDVEMAPPTSPKAVDLKPDVVQDADAPKPALFLGNLSQSVPSSDVSKQSIHVVTVVERKEAPPTSSLPSPKRTPALLPTQSPLVNSTSRLTSSYASLNVRNVPQVLTSVEPFIVLPISDALPSDATSSLLDSDLPQVTSPSPHDANTSRPLNAPTQPCKDNDEPQSLEEEVFSRPIETAIESLPTPAPTPQLRTPEAAPAPQSALPSDILPVLEDIPDYHDAKTIAEALRIVVMTRLLCDRQTRDELVNPVLLENRAIASRSYNPRPGGTFEEITKEVTESTQFKTRMNTFVAVTKASLVERFRERQAFLEAKTKRLKEEYLTLQKRWVAHCAALDEQSKPPAIEAEAVQPTGRTTRRSTANLGDAVRSDLEMEQIIASLGNDDATDPHHLSQRNIATIPDMISVTRGEVDYYFDDTNHAVENPSEYYAPHTGMHDWMEQEKEIFLDKFAAHPKQFGLIAEHIPNKTASQCVSYYYLHKKKFIDFRKVISLYAPNKRKRKGTGKKKGNALLTDIRQHDAEVRDSGSSSRTGRAARGKKTMPPPSEPKKSAASRRRVAVHLEVTPSAGSETPTPEPEMRTRRRRAVGAPVSRTVSVSLEEAEQEPPSDVERPAKRMKRTRKIKSAAIVTEEPTTSETKPAEEAISNRRKTQSNGAPWSEDDKDLFLALLAQHGSNFKRIAASMPNKTTVQVSNYYKVNSVAMDLEKVAAAAPRRSATPEEPRKESSTFVFAMAPPASDSMPPSQVSLASPPQSVETAKQTDVEIKSLSNRHSIGMAAATVRKKRQESVAPAGHSRTRALSPSQVRSQYPSPSLAYSGPVPRTAPYISNPVPSSSRPPAQPIQYTYPTYTDPHYPPYGARLSHQPMAHPFAMPDQMRRVTTLPPIRTRENPYPILPEQGAPPPPYHHAS